MQQRTIDEYLKPIDENTIMDKQSRFHEISFSSSIIHNVVPESTTTNSQSASSTTYSPAVHEATRRFLLLRRDLSIFSQESLPQRTSANIRPKRISIYDHIQPKIDSGLSRADNKNRKHFDDHRLGPSRSINWQLLKNYLEQDSQICEQSKQIRFNSDHSYKMQLTILGNIILAKVKNLISSMGVIGAERYKILIHFSVFQKEMTELCIASRCLWNSVTDNFITIKMHGTDCDILIVIFLCYTELGIQ